MAVTQLAMYSQQDEEKWILQSVGDMVGRFLDIGAWDPKCFSNVRALYERGWGGVIIEPSPGPFLRQVEEYGKDERIILIHAAIGHDRSLVKFHCTDDAVSTTEAGNYERWKSGATFKGSFYVPQITLAEVFNQFGGPFDFVNIDTEGTSFGIFSELMATPLMPKCICVEHDERVIELHGIARAKGYQQVGFNDTNIVFAR